MSVGNGILGMATSLPPGGGGGVGATLPRLREETELQKMLADEKMRSEQHKNNYQTLKNEHTRLQDEYVGVQSELKTTIEESRLVQEKYKTLIEQARKDLASKAAEIDELRNQTLTSARLEMIRLQLQDEIEKPYRDKMDKLSGEAEHFRSEYNKLKYEFSFLKAEYDHERSEHGRVMDEVKLRHEAEVGNLRQEREAIFTRQQSDGVGHDAQRLRSLQRENAQLQLRLKGLSSEVEEVRAQKEQHNMHTDSVSRQQAKQLAEQSAGLKAMETEKESLKLQLQSLQRELSDSSQQLTQMSTRLHDFEKDNIMLKNRAEEVTHRSRVELTNLKMDMLKERGDLERQKDRLTGEIEDLKSQTEIHQHSISQQRAAVADKEHDAAKRVQAAREEEWAKLHAVENDKMALETKLQELERRKIDEESHRHAEKERWEDRLRQANDCKDVAEKEALVFKTKVSHQESLLTQLERERSENSELKTRLHRIESQYQTYVSSEQEFVDINERLKSQVDQLGEDLRVAREALSRQRTDSDATLVQHRAGWADERASLQKRCSELEEQLSEVTDKLEKTLAVHRRRKKKIANLVSRLKDRVALQSAKLSELKVQNEALRKSVPTDVHMQMKKQMRDLIRRHQEFRTVMLAGGQVKEVTIGDKSFASVGIPTEYTAQNFSFIDAADHYEKDLARLKERMDLLDDNQQHQMAQLRPISPMHETRLKSRPVIKSRSSDTDFTESERDTDKENYSVEKSV